jgi:hypothetical protein
VGEKTSKTKKSLLISQKRFRAADLSFSGQPEQELAPSSGMPEGLLRFRRALPSTFLDKKINNELGTNIQLISSAPGMMLKKSFVG